MTTPWTPRFGVHPEGDGARVRVCAPGASRVQVHPENGDVVALEAMGQGVFEGRIGGLAPGRRYKVQVDDHQPWPDPWSRCQPEGVHAASVVIDPAQFTWTDAGWTGVPREQLVIYELHVGTFTREGTFAAATARLPELAALGVTAIELMPIAAFPGTRNWGYDGGSWFAPAAAYGHPDDLRALIDAAHALGLAVLLDVVYNHLGPDGAYLAAFMPTFFTDRHHTPWGRAINLDGPGSAEVRRIICDNALSWLHEYHLDGLRLDATHALIDTSDEHVLAQLAREVATEVTGRHVHLIAEDERNFAPLMLPLDGGGSGLTGVWADDFHHAMRRRLAGDHEAWFSDFDGSTREVATALARGWVFSGQTSPRSGKPRGTSPDALPLEAFVICLQNHDQIGNRAHGDRLHHQIDATAWLAASTVLLTSPETPLLFMGQEWAASTPFLFFTDHEPTLGAQVVAGRREEFGRFAAFADPLVREQIPDPQAVSTFDASILDWSERDTSPHADALAATTRLLEIRRAHVSSASRRRDRIHAVAPDDHIVMVAQRSTTGGMLLTVADLTGEGVRRVAVPAAIESSPSVEVLFSTHPDVRVETSRDADAGGLVLSITDISSEPFGLVIHLTGVPL
ncbi:MAG TPA: malto-oligosyltrehalose trehalohydrolase [Luteitalea sp.]|nr:malto-oligosyltrehalose trehalohydrolase [Luteitalea sp.]